MKTQGVRSDPEGDVELVEAFWNKERLGLGGATVPIPLVIADVLASLDGRNIEAARELGRSGCVVLKVVLPLEPGVLRVIAAVQAATRGG